MSDLAWPGRHSVIDKQLWRLILFIELQEKHIFVTAVETVNVYLTSSPARRCLRPHSHRHRRQSSPPPQPRLPPPPPVHQNGALRHHGDTHTSPLVSSARLWDERLAVNVTAKSTFRTSALMYMLLHEQKDFFQTTHFFFLWRRRLCVFHLHIYTCARAVESYRRQGDVASQSSPASRAASRSWSWSVTAPSWSLAAGPSSLGAFISKV